MNVSHVMCIVLSMGFGVCAMDTAHEWRQAERHAEAMRLIAVCADKGGTVQVGKDLQPVCAAPMFMSRRAM